MLGSNLYVKWEKVLVIKAPQYKDLYVKDLLKFAASKLNIKKYLPDYEYNKESNKEWICNLLNTLIDEDFQYFIKEKQKLENMN